MLSLTHSLTHALVHSFFMHALTHIYVLTVLEVSIRHNGDLEFHKILNKIRMGKFSRFELERYFCNNIVYNEVESSHNSCIEFSEDSYVGAESSLIKVSKLECINGDVDNGNNKCFEELPGESIEYSLLNVS